jgi:hypothetical protein
MKINEYTNIFKFLKLNLLLINKKYILKLNNNKD